MKYVKLFSVFFFSLFLLSSSSLAQDNMMKDKKDDKMMDKKEEKMMDDKMDKEMMMHDNMMTKIDKDEHGLAIKGYDPVAYFTDGKPVMGKAEHSYKWNGAEWHFANVDHLKKFKENPSKYTPQYGGFCAYGITLNSYFSTQPDVWKIVDGKLYLNKNKDIGEEWKKDIKGNIKKGDENWMKLSSEK
jgi:YHS domain-containing protein